MDPTQSIPVKTYLPAATLLAVIGWGGLLFIILYTLPTIGPRWLLFFFFLLAIVGMVMPLIAYLHLRFPTKPPIATNVVVRQSILVGVYFSTLVWLQIGRVLTLGLALLVAAGLIFLELLLRLRERSQWKPGQTPVESKEQPQ
jgi:hypothetical protein